MILRNERAVVAVIEIALYISEHNPGAADRFVRAVEKTLTSLERRPGLGHPWESDSLYLVGVRVYGVLGFRKYRVFYRPVPEGIQFVHVLHGARDLPRALEGSRKGVR